MGGEYAEAAVAELEQVVSQRKATSAARANNTAQEGPNDVLGDGLTVLLLLWAQPSATLLQRCVASPVVYPLLATLILQCQRHRSVKYECNNIALLESSAPSLSLQKILHKFFCGSPTTASPTTVHEAETTFTLPEAFRVENVLSLLVLSGRIPAAAELHWRSMCRPLALYKVSTGVASLVNGLQNAQTLENSPAFASRCAQALLVLHNTVEQL